MSRVCDKCGHVEMPPLPPSEHPEVTAERRRYEELGRSVKVVSSRVDLDRHMLEHLGSEQRDEWMGFATKDAERHLVKTIVEELGVVKIREPKEGRYTTVSVGLAICNPKIPAVEYIVNNQKNLEDENKQLRRINTALTKLVARGSFADKMYPDLLLEYAHDCRVECKEFKEFVGVRK